LSRERDCHTNTGCTATGVALGTPTTADNCGVASVTNNAPGAFAIGVTSVTWTVTDNSGNTATCVQTVTVSDNVNPTITCPANVTANTNTGCTATGVALGTPTTADNCGVASVTNNAPGAFAIGVTSVTWTVTDNSGNTATCIQTVTVSDNVNPTITCPANVTATTNTGCTATGVALGTPTTADNCGVASVTNNAPGAFAIGVTSVTWTVTDNSGNTATCVQTVTVSDNVNPTITCPANVTANTNTGCTATGVALGTPTTADNCGVASVTNNAPGAFAIGVTSVTWTVTDNSGNTATCVQTVTVSDNVNPTITCPANVTATTNTGCTATGVALGTPTTADNCGVASVTNNAPGAFAIGVTSVTWTVTDNSGNTATCVQTVTVNDNVNPVATCQPVTVNLDGFGNADVTAAQVNNGSTDNCTIATLTLTTYQYHAVGTYTDTLIVTDAAGNVDSCFSVITVVDNNPPVANCKDTTIYLNAAGTATINPIDIDGGSTDNGFIASRTASQTAFDCSDLGANNDTLYVTDNGGNIDSCIAVVTVLDTIAPNATCQAVTVQLDASGNATVTAAAVNNGSTDNCTVASLSVSPSAFTCANTGANTVTLTVTDQSGNVSTCTATVTVQDNLNPTITCPANVTANTNTGCTATGVALGTPTTADNCGVASVTNNAPGAFAIGVTSVTWTVTDNSGNTATCVQTVTVSDNVNPTITCPANVTATTNTGCTATGVALGTPTTADNCGVASVTNNAPGAFAIGVTSVTWTVTDNSGNTATCVQTVTVSDNVNPTITCPANVTANTNTGCTATGVALGTPTTADNCGVASVTNNAPGAFAIGVTSVTWTVTDNSGNTATCVQTVTVSDNVNPTITCPANVTANTNTGCTATGVALGTPTTADNCGVASVTNNAPGAFLIGVTSVTWTVTDNSGNTATCIQTVTVSDNVNPTITCPANVTATTNTGCTATGVALGTPTTADNCGVASVVNDAPGAFPIGATSVTWTVTDNSGNTATCVQTVTVNDNVNPVATCQPVTVNLDGFGNADVTAAQVNNGSTDNCTIATLTLTTYQYHAVGTYTDTLIVTDAAGNVDSCFSVITVVDNNPPVANCKDTTIYLNAAGTATINPIDIDGGSTDNGFIASRTASQTAFDCSHLGANNDTLYVTDNGGNTDSCIAVVTVLDTIAPNAICQAVTVQLDASGNGTLTAAQVNNGSTDNCTVASLSIDVTSFTCANIGANTVTLTVTDQSGNVSTCTATVTVQDNVAPVAICQAVTIQLDAAGAATLTAAQVNNGSNDACGIASVSVSKTTFDCTNVGANTVTLTVTDNNGNVSTCTATITVQDLVAPTAICQAVTTYLNASGVATINASDLNNGSSDNCGGALTFSASQTSFNCSEAGANTVVLTVTDANGNTATCSTTVTVVDNIAPVAVCQAVTVNLDAFGNADVTAAQVNNTSTDNCAVTGMTLTTYQYHAVGTYTDTLIVTDAAGNVDSCFSVITVVDNNPPVANCKDTTIYLNAAGTATINPIDIDGGSTDNGFIASRSASQTAFDCSDLGANNDTLYVTDNGGNTDSCIAVVTVLDTIAPTAICQAVTVQLDASGNATVTAAAVNNNSTDNCTVASLSVSPSAFTCANIGANTVTLTVTDQSGNVSTCTATVTVQDNVAPVAICQAVTIQLDAAGAATLTAAQVNNGSNDACGIASVSVSKTTFDCTNVGANTVTLTVTDNNGNVSTCTATITVQDLVAPTAICQAVTTYLNASGVATINASDLNNGSSDNCGGVLTFSASQTSFNCSEAGANTVVLTVTDANGNTATCSTTVTVVDNIAPVAVCQPATISLDALSGWAVVTPADINGGSTDNCAITSMIVEPDSMNAVGTYNVDLIVFDAAGNSDTCTAVVTIVDLSPPVAVCNDTTIYLNAAGTATITAQDLDGGSTDNGVITTWAASQLAFDCNDLGANTDTLFVTDDGGNTSFCEATVTVLDTIKPNAICQAVTVQLDASGNATVTAAAVNNGSADNCTVASLSVSPSAFTCANIGANTVTLTVTDQSGNVSTCTATVTVQDNVAPTAICQAVTIQLDAAGAATLTAAQVNNGSNDACGIASVSVSKTTFDCTNVGANTVTLTVTDNNGNVSTCTATITVQDLVAPTAICQAVTTYLNASGVATINASDLNNGSSDNCGGALTFSASQTSFNCSEAGANTVVLTVTDANGNTATCSTTVTVVDNIAPVAVCQAASINLDANGWAIVTPAAINGGSTDNCAITSMIVEPDSLNTVGTHNVNLIVFDAAGNSDTCTAVVTAVDNNPPHAVCKPDTIYLNNVGQATLTGADIDGGSYDNGTIVSLTPSQTNFNCNHLGTNNIALTVTDNGGNTNICIAVVTVLDTISPNAMCKPVTVQLNAAGTASITAAMVNNGSTDNCTVASVSLDNTNFDCTNVGTNTVTLTVTDNSGNSSTCTATITVQDLIAPTITCPANVTATTNTGCTATGVALGTPTIADNCTGSTVSNNAPAAFPIGNTTVIWTVTDASGNTATCNQTVTVTDNVPPVAVCQPYTIYLNAAGSASIIAANIDGGSTDNCGIASIVAGQTAFSCTNLGTNNVVLTVTDNSGNSSTCTAVVTVLDTISPVANCQPVTVGLDLSGNADVTAAQVNNGSTDNCSVTGMTLTTYQYHAVGTYTDTLIVTDASGNVDSCFAVITVVDNNPPTATCNDTIIYLDGSGNATITAQDLDGGSTDNGVITTWAASQLAFDCSDLGANSDTLFVTDDGGNTSFCEAIVTVLDTIAPNAICQAVTVQLDASGNGTLSAAQVNNGSTDNCTVATLSLDVTSFTCANIGSANTVTLTVTDQSGNSSTCTATITVEDNVAPNAICQNVTVQLDATGNGSITAAQIDGGSNDACGIASISASQAAFDCSNIGTNTVTLTVTDNNGNVSTCNATVTVADTIAPVANCQAVTTYLDAAGSASINASDLNNGSTDACGGLTFSASQTTFDCSETGANTVVLTVTDVNGNSSTCSTTVTVLDTINPVAICQTDTINMGNNGDPSWAVVFPTALNGGSTDNCVSTTFTANIDSLNAVGNYPVTLFVTDASGNVDSCTTIITVIDVNPPVTICNDTTIYLDGSGNASITPSMIDGGSYDNGAIASIAASQLDFDCSHIGTNADTLFVTDDGGNTSYCVATVTVLDTIAPAAICQDITVALNASGIAVLTGVMFNNSTTDNCGTGTITYTVDIANPDSVGTYAVVLTATDASGNSSTCSSTLTVIDTIAPAAICQDTTIYLDASGNASITPDMIDGGSTDNGTIANISASQLAFDCSNIGANSDTLFVTDQGGNTSFCVATVTVLDTIAPTVICQGVSVELDATGTAVITPIMLDNGSTDNCGTGTLTYSTSDSTFTDVGGFTVVLTVTDASGNSSTCTTTVTVNDTIAPVAVCQPDTIYLDASGNASIVATDINGGSTDNDIIVSYTASQMAFDCSNIGGNTVTLVVTDAGGNTDSCQTTVTVLDTIAPTIVCQSITIGLDSTGTAVIIATDIDGGTTDNCGTGTLTYTASDTSFAAVGSYTVTLTVTDASGNTSNCAATVLVADGEPPVAICKPDTIYLNNAGNASIIALDINGGSTDNDTIVSYVASQYNFSCANLGNNNVTLTVTDAGGNTDNCVAVVTVLDTIAPVAICQNITVTLPISGQVTVAPAQLNNGSMDNCTTLTYSISQTLFEHVGSFPDTLTVTDGSGNTSYCISTVTVTDLIAPVAICQPDTIYLNNSGAASIVPADIDGGSTDNGTIVSMTASQTAFNCSHIGNNNVTLIVTDEAGNNAFCTAVVTVLDTIAPTAMCQSITVPQASGGIAVITGVMVNGGSTDNCGNGLTYNVDQDTLPGTGTYTVILTVTDASGNSSTCESTVTVLDNTAPNAECQPITVYVDATGNVTISGQDIDGGSTDNDTIVSYVASPNTFNCGNLGLNTSVLTVTDASGNTDLCVAQVTVLDTIAPIVVCQDITVPIGANGTVTITASQINGATADNCTGTLTYVASQTFFPGTGTYTDTLTVTDASGNVSYCIATVTVTDVTAPITICQDTTIYLDGNGNASISASDLDGGTTDNGGSYIFTASQTVFDCGDLGSNQVVLSATDLFGNIGTCTALVTVLDTIAPTVICNDTTIIMDFYSNAWLDGFTIDGGSTDNCGDGALTYTSSITEFHEEGTFAVTLTVTDASGNSSTCTAMVTVQQPVKPLKIPSGFSPNGDGIADTWEIQGLREYPDNSVVIFNRWGGKLFEAKPYLNDWAGQVTVGTLPGNLPAGTYFYQLDLGNGDVRTGYLQVNR
jgi:gliding motility-associated-like protein